MSSEISKNIKRAQGANTEEKTRQREERDAQENAQRLVQLRQLDTVIDGLGIGRQANERSMMSQYAIDASVRNRSSDMDEMSF